MLLFCWKGYNYSSHVRSPEQASDPSACAFTPNLVLRAAARRLMIDMKNHCGEKKKMSERVSVEEGSFSHRS